MQLLLAAALILAAQSPPPTQPSTQPSEPARKGLAQLRWESARVEAFARSPLAKAFIARVAELPEIPPRTLFHNADKSRWFPRAKAGELPAAERAGLESMEIDEETYYTTRYGSPLSYVRALDLLADHGISTVNDKRILDFGYGYIGHLRLLALLGAEAHGVDVDPMLAALYSDPLDRGAMKSKTGAAGKVVIHEGRFPADAAITAEIGGGYDVIISKNVLKLGYIHPRRKANPKKLIDLGVGDDAFLAALNRVLVPGGIVLVYNLAPAQAPADKPYIPWADGQTPFPRAAWEKAGFEVREFDRDDNAAARAMAKALGWDLPSDGEPGMDLENGLFAWYTVAKKKR